ncbi:MAG: phage head closure protein [Janthinobacterium lividum]
MNFGKQDRLVTLQQPQPAPADSFGGAGQQQLFSDVAEVWAEQKPGAGSEVLQGDQQVAVQVSTWLMRYRADVQPTWQLTYEGAVYAITGVQEIGRRAGLTLTTYRRG